MTVVASQASGDDNLPRKLFDIRELWGESFPQSPEMPFGAVTLFGAFAESPAARAAIRNSYLEGLRQIGIEEEMSRLKPSLALLATTANTAPFIGLFGTVWGIMHSFQAILPP